MDPATLGTTVVVSLLVGLTIFSALMALVEHQRLVKADPTSPH